jgi:hypothetical protein
MHFEYVPVDDPTAPPRPIYLKVRDVIDDPNHVTFWAGPSGISVPVYDFSVHIGKVNAPPIDLCTSNPGADTWDGLDTYALAYRGERYDPVHKTNMPTNYDEGWAFLACKGGGGTKLHLSRQTYAAQWDTIGFTDIIYPTTIEHRTAFLKAVTADYCGDGTGTYTVFGQPLRYAASEDPNQLDRVWPTRTSMEALWKDKGAICLDTPRHVDRSQVNCDLPSCASLQTSMYSVWTDVGYAITENP